MNSTVFTVGLACLVLGAILGMIGKHLQDTKYFKEMADFTRDQMRKVMKEDEEIIGRLTKENNRLQIELMEKAAKSVVSNNKVIFVPREMMPEADKAIITDEKFFTDLAHEPLPDDWEDIDFGGKF